MAGLSVWLNAILTVSDYAAISIVSRAGVFDESLRRATLVLANEAEAADQLVARGDLAFWRRSHAANALIHARPNFLPPRQVYRALHLQIREVFVETTEYFAARVGQRRNTSVLVRIIFRMLLTGRLLRELGSLCTAYRRKSCRGDKQDCSATRQTKRNFRQFHLHIIAKLNFE